MTGVLFLVGGELRAAVEGLDQFAEWCEGRMGTMTEEVMELFWLKVPGKYEQRDDCLKAAGTQFYCLYRCFLSFNSSHFCLSFGSPQQPE